VNIVDALQGVTHLFLDSAPVIYFVERNQAYLSVMRAVFQSIQAGSPIVVTSPITLAECLVRPFDLGQTQLQRAFINTIATGTNTIFVPITDPIIAIQAAQIRAKYNLQLPDAFQIAVALNAECESFFN
jgi:predicted nucleic acid-binding protein